MNAEEQVAKLNRSEHVVTWKLVQINPADTPFITGEIRYIVPMVSSSMMPLLPRQIIWTGAQWILVPKEIE